MEPNFSTRWQSDPPEVSPSWFGDPDQISSPSSTPAPFTPPVTPLATVYTVTSQLVQHWLVNISRSLLLSGSSFIGQVAEVVDNSPSTAISTQHSTGRGLAAFQPTTVHHSSPDVDSILSPTRVYVPTSSPTATTDSLLRLSSLDAAAAENTTPLSGIDYNRVSALASSFSSSIAAEEHDESPAWLKTSHAVVSSLYDGISNAIAAPTPTAHHQTSLVVNGNDGSASWWFATTTPSSSSSTSTSFPLHEVASIARNRTIGATASSLYSSLVYSTSSLDSDEPNQFSALSSAAAASLTPHLSSLGGGEADGGDSNFTTSSWSWWRWAVTDSAWSPASESDNVAPSLSSWLVDLVTSSAINVTGGVDYYESWDQGSGWLSSTTTDDEFDSNFSINASATPSFAFDFTNLTMGGGGAGVVGTVGCVPGFFDNGSSGGGLCWSPDVGTDASAATTLAGSEAGPLEPGKEYWALVLLLFPLFTVFGNVLVILSVYKERNLHTVTNYFIVSLAVADLLVAALVMPFAVYFLVNVSWELSPFLCDFYIAMDVACSTSSIFNLVAISIDRFIAVTQPIKYAKHKNSNRVALTIAIVWVVSAAIGSPIVLGLNTSPERNPNLCIFYNPDFIIYSSLSSFYIPCIIMVFLYYRIFRVIHERALKTAAAKRIANQHANNSAAGGKRPLKQPATVVDTVIENVAHARLLPPGGGNAVTNPATARGVGALRTLFRYKETVTLCVSLEPDQPTANTESGSQDMDEEEEVVLGVAGSGGGGGGNGAALMDLSAAVIRNERSPAGCTEFALGPLLTDGSSSTGPATSSSTLTSSGCGGGLSLPKSASGQRDLLLEPNGNHDSGYGASSHTGAELETTFLNQVVIGSESGHLIGTPLNAGPLPGSPKRLERRRSGGGSARNNKGSKRNGAPAGSGSSGLGAGTPCGTDGASERSWTLSMQGSERGGQTGDGSLSPGRRKKPRFHLARTHKSSRKKREKSAAKKERKATKTLAIVLGVFLACWVPFFTCNILDAISIKLNNMDMQPGVTAFVLTTWLGYMNSFINPVIYTIFNPEFRKAFKKILFGN